MPIGTLKTDMSNEFRIYSNKFASNIALVKFSQWICAGNSKSPIPLKKSAWLFTAVNSMEIAGTTQTNANMPKIVYLRKCVKLFLM
jgi:hypothetical protein